MIISPVNIPAPVRLCFLIRDPHPPDTDTSDFYRWSRFIFIYVVLMCREKKTTVLESQHRLR